MEHKHLEIQIKKIFLPELMFWWDGLYPITSKVSNVLSLRRNKFFNAENLYQVLNDF
jgi:hypothetical protein